MRRRLLLIPVVAASVAVPPLVGATAQASPLAKRPSATSTKTKTVKPRTALPIAEPAGRRWN